MLAHAAISGFRKERQEDWEFKVIISGAAISRPDQATRGPASKKGGREGRKERRVEGRKQADRQAAESLLTRETAFPQPLTLCSLEQHHHHLPLPPLTSLFRTLTCQHPECNLVDLS